MTHVIIEPCIGTCDTSCVEVCPVDCIHPTKDEWAKYGYNPEDLAKRQLYINPEDCIDCGACVPECPVEAIFPEDSLPEGQEPFTKINADFFKK